MQCLSPIIAVFLQPVRQAVAVLSVVIVHLIMQTSLLHMAAGICNPAENGGSYAGLLHEENKQ